jgi:glutathione-regulated potassium-efflux system ancillary protein KefC
MTVSSWLLQSLVFLGAAVLAVPIARALGLGAVIGYLAAGIAIGPWGLQLVTEAGAILRFAEFGVVLMLFLVGLELDPKRLWQLRVPIFGWGSVQLLGSTALLAAIGIALGLDWRVALVAGLALAQSSTAIALATLAERNLMPTTGGRSILSVSLFQDIGGIAILTLLPLLAVQAAPGARPGWQTALVALAMVLLIVFGGRLLLRPALRWIARSRTPEIFTAASLLLVVATAALMQAAGLSMALGAFLAGVLLAESEFRRQLETDLAPFKGLLLGLFFIAVGMSIDFAVVLAHPLAMAGAVLGFVAVKALVVWAMARHMGIPLAERPVFVVMLAQGGEFGFVVLQAAGGAALMPAATGSFLLAAITISMLLTPLVMLLVDRLVAPRLASDAATAMAEIDEAQEAPILILGFGRYGQIVARLINACGLAATVLDHDAEQVASVRRFGWPAFYGDATRLDLLRTAGAAEARVIVVAIDGVEQSLAVVDLLRQHFAQATLVVRARNTTHWYALHQRGVEHIERETLDAALMSGRSVLEAMGWERHAARTQALRFRRHSIELLKAMAPHQGDEKQLISMVRQGRQELEELWSSDPASAPGAARRREPQRILDRLGRRVGEPVGDRRGLVAVVEYRRVPGLRHVRHRHRLAAAHASDGRRRQCVRGHAVQQQYGATQAGPFGPLRQRPLRIAPVGQQRPRVVAVDAPAVGVGPARGLPGQEVTHLVGHRAVVLLRGAYASHDFRR